MMNIELIRNNTDLKETLERCYSSDSNFLNKYHEINGTLNDCIQRTFSDFVTYSVSVFKVSFEDEFIGFFGKSLFDNKVWLTGFFILPEYRNEFHKHYFFETIRKELGNEFYSGILFKNKPARKYFKQNRGIFTEYQESQDGLGMIYMFKGGL